MGYRVMMVGIDDCTRSTGQTCRNNTVENPASAVQVLVAYGALQRLIRNDNFLKGSRRDFHCTDMRRLCD